MKNNISKASKSAINFANVSLRRNGDIVDIFKNLP